jgi:hypothetical protein
MEWVGDNHMEHIGHTKIKKSSNPEAKTIGACWVLGGWLIDSQGFSFLSLGS